MEHMGWVKSMNSQKNRGPVVVLCPAGTAATGGPFLKTLVVDDHSSMAMQRLDRLRTEVPIPFF